MDEAVASRTATVTRADTIPAMVGRLHHVVLDTADPAGLAEFWSRILDQPVTFRSAQWVVVSADERTSGLAFQLAPDHRPPTWPDPAVPQQVHLDVMVDDLSAARSEVLRLGARELGAEHIYADPAGHPFCLIMRPPWAPPINRPGGVNDSAPAT